MSWRVCLGWVEAKKPTFQTTSGTVTLATATGEMVSWNVLAAVYLRLCLRHVVRSQSASPGAAPDHQALADSAAQRIVDGDLACSLHPAAGRLYALQVGRVRSCGPGNAAARRQQVTGQLQRSNEIS